MGNGDVRKRGTVATVESDFLLCTPLLLNLPKYLTNKIWLRFRNSINLNWRRQEKSTAFHRSNWTGEARKWILMTSTLPICTVQSIAIASLLSVEVQLCKMQRDWMMFKWQCWPFQIKRIVHASHWLMVLLLHLPVWLLWGPGGMKTVTAHWWKENLRGNTVNVATGKKKKKEEGKTGLVS